MILQQPLLHAWKKQFHTVLGLQGVCPCKLSEFFQKSGQVLIKLLAVHAPKPDVILGAVHREVPHNIPQRGWMKEQGETEENCQENANPDQRPGNGLSETLRGEEDFF